MGESRQVLRSETGIGSSDALKSSFHWNRYEEIAFPAMHGRKSKTRPRSNQSNAALRALRRAADSAMLSAKLAKNAELIQLKIYKGAPRGMCTTVKSRVNQDLLAFIGGTKARRAA